jgi:hypothetical protein
VREPLSLRAWHRMTFNDKDELSEWCRCLRGVGVPLRPEGKPRSQLGDRVLVGELTSYPACKP